MLLAFQRDDSTSFTKSAQHRQHHREMGENGCTCLCSVYASVQTVYAFEYICVCVCSYTFCVCTVSVLLRPYFSYRKECVGGTCTFLSLHKAYRLHQKACNYMRIQFQILARVQAFLYVPQYEVKNKKIKKVNLQANARVIAFVDKSIPAG